MLANMVAEKYTNIYEVDWVEVTRSAKEFSGHTYASLRSIYMSRLVRNAKMKQRVDTVTPLQVMIIKTIKWKQSGHQDTFQFLSQNGCSF